jgi:hypothetical protein
MLAENDIGIIYSGPIWAGGIDGMAEMLLKRLEYDDISLNVSQSVFSTFVEQMNNMLMYSAENEKRHDTREGRKKKSRGIYIIGIKNSEYFIQTGNVVTDRISEILKERIDYLNTLDKKEMRQYYKELLKAEDDNPESKGAGIGLIEIARRTSSPIEYSFEPLADGLQYFTMYITINQKG